MHLARSKAASGSRATWSISESRAPDATFLERTVNGQPGLVAQQNGVTGVAYAFDIAGDQIGHTWAVLNPDKLRPWTAA